MAWRVLALVLVAGLATFLPGAMGGQRQRALPVQARLMSDSSINGVPQTGLGGVAKRKAAKAKYCYGRDYFVVKVFGSLAIRNWVGALSCLVTVS